ncbi:hypothetical protein JW935_13175 [candidate division KSB1 bacterium]|nr:hypothetical protein [candidate division KSB1 bacterium]
MNLSRDYTNFGSSRPKQKIGHELRSLTHGLLGYLAVFGEEIKPKLNREETELLTRINIYAEKLSDLVLFVVSEKINDNAPNSHES